MTLEQIQPRRHASSPRGLDPLATPPSQPGQFGRLFVDCPSATWSDETLNLLARTMIKPLDPGEPEQDLGGQDDDENTAIPAGYTYLGQFIDHDLTFDPASSLQRQSDPSALVDFRTPRFDLDSVYGRGPADEPYLYGGGEDLDIGDRTLHLPAGLKFLLGGHDLQRNAVGRALIGDPRNDENLIVSQLHQVFLRFHNAVVDFRLEWDLQTRSQAAVQRDLDTPDWANAFFADVQQLVRWHYQWVIVHDFLPRICGQDVVNDILGKGGLFQPLSMFHPSGGQVFIPVEFSVAAYRFGHSMVRPGYFLNEANRRQRLRNNADPLRTPILGPADGEGVANLNGFRPLPIEALIDWRFFFGGSASAGKTCDGRPLPQFSYKIDTQLAAPLGDLPSPVVSSPPVSLAERNLLRGRSLGLPSGQSVASFLGRTPLSDEMLGLTVEGLRERATAVGIDVSDDQLARAAAELVGTAPLWFYVLREAELSSADGGSAGARLVGLGANIVAGVMLGLLADDPRSYLRANPRFTPESAFIRDGTSFDAAALVNFATSRPRAARAVSQTRTTMTQIAIPATDILEFILDNIPYRYDKPAGEPTLLTGLEAAQLAVTPRETPANPTDNAGMAYEVSGPAYDRNETNPLEVAEEKALKDDPTTCLWWKFGEKTYRVTKAYKIPYQVLQDGSSTPVIKHLLIGYMGIDGGG